MQRAFNSARPRGGGGGAGLAAAGISFACSKLMGTGAAWAAAGPDTVAAAQAAVPRYEHIFVIIAENQLRTDHRQSRSRPTSTGSPRPTARRRSSTARCIPAKANYIAMLGGDTFGIHDDDAYFCNAGSTTATANTPTRSTLTSTTP